MNLLKPTPKGLYCPAADLYIDPVRKVGRAIITHGHADHVHRGVGEVLTSASGEPIVRHRLGKGPKIESLAYGKTLRIGEAKLSLHPAGHILGSAQVRIEVDGKTAVVTGDYKRGDDPTCEPFEPVPCDLLVTESTFGLPAYTWPSPAQLTDELDRWWAENQTGGLPSVLLGYSLGKAQRLLAMLRPERGPILVHGAIIPFLALYRKAGIVLPETLTLNAGNLNNHRGDAMILMPPGAFRGSLRKKLSPCRSALASGWTLTGDTRQGIQADTGFAVSDHADWGEILQTVQECAPEELWATHGYREEVCTHFASQGLTTRMV